MAPLGISRLAGRNPPALSNSPFAQGVFFRVFCSILINSQPLSGHAANVLSAASLRRDDKLWLIVAN